MSYGRFHRIDHPGEIPLVVRVDEHAGPMNRPQKKFLLVNMIAAARAGAVNVKPNHSDARSALNCRAPSGVPAFQPVGCSPFSIPFSCCQPSLPHLLGASAKKHRSLAGFGRSRVNRCPGAEGGAGFVDVQVAVGVIINRSNLVALLPFKVRLCPTDPPT